MKTDHWALMRECTRLMETNKKKWLERKEQEELRRLDEEKKLRLEEGKLKKNHLMKKLKAKKETKPERSKRMEEEKRNAGRQAIRTQLWRQRREKDGRLVEVWSTSRKSVEQEMTANLQLASSHLVLPSSQVVQNEKYDQWLLELTLSEEERTALQQLESRHVVLPSGT